MGTRDQDLKNFNIISIFKYKYFIFSGIDALLKKIKINKCRTLKINKNYNPIYNTKINYNSKNSYIYHYKNKIFTSK